MFLQKHHIRVKCFLTFILATCFIGLLQAQAPANDACNGAIPLSITPLNGACPTILYSNVNGTDATGANTSPNPTCFNGLKGFKDVWFRFTTPATGTQNYSIEVTGINAADSLSNAQIAVYIGDCTVGLLEEYCSAPPTATNGRLSKLDAGNAA
jgi:hypothetical protein